MKQLLTSLFCFMAIVALHAQSPSPVNWKISTEKTGDNEYTITAKATINDGWYVYSQFLGDDLGPIPTEIYLEKNKAIEKVGPPTEEGEKMSGYDKLFEMEITKFKHSMTVQQKIKVNSPTTLVGYVTFMTCNDNSCLPPNDIEFQFELK